MSLYWPEQNVALEIVDDPASEPFDTVAHPDATVIRVTCTQIEDPEALDEVARQLALGMGSASPRPMPFRSHVAEPSTGRCLIPRVHNQFVYMLYLLWRYNEYPIGASYALRI